MPEVVGSELGVALFVASRALEERAYRAAVDAGGVDITVAQSRLLARVGPAGTRLVELAAQARVSKQTAGHLVDQLERAGYVERVADPADGRAKLVRLTPRARALVPAANAEVERVVREWTDEVGADRMQVLDESLRMIRDIAERR